MERRSAEQDAVTARSASRRSMPAPAVPQQPKRHAETAPPAVQVINSLKCCSGQMLDLLEPETAAW